MQRIGQNRAFVACEEGSKCISPNRAPAGRPENAHVIALGPLGHARNCELAGKPNDRQCRLSKPPGERFEAVEILRRIAYEYDPATERLQRVLRLFHFAGAESPLLSAGEVNPE